MTNSHPHSSLLGVLITIILLGIALSQLSEALHSIPSVIYLLHLGVGSPSALTLVDSRIIPSTTISIVILANLPQTVYSLVYLSYNAILTRMFLSLEWSKYSAKYSGLRTSWALGQQRSTFLLQLPYHYAIPFVVLSLLLHWMISSSLFFVKARVFVHGVEQVYSGGGNRGNKTFETLGYSPIAIIACIFLAVVMMAAVLGHARRKYRPGMPFAAACSAAISAACHAEHGDVVFDKMVKWGLVNEAGDVDVEHCTFGVTDVHGLEDGRSYA